MGRLICPPSDVLITHVSSGRGNRSGSRDGDDGSRDQALKCPVVRAVRLGHGQVRDGVVDGALEDGCKSVLVGQELGHGRRRTSA
jgi:hypothetical protein